MNNFIVSSGLAVSAGFIGLMYDGYATKYGWPMGRLFRNHQGWIVTIAWLCVIPGSVELINQLSWLLGIVSILLSFISALILTGLLKERIQWISILMILASILVWTIGGIEIIEIK